MRRVHVVGVIPKYVQQSETRPGQTWAVFQFNNLLNLKPSALLCRLQQRHNFQTPHPGRIKSSNFKSTHDDAWELVCIKYLLAPYLTILTVFLL